MCSSVLRTCTWKIVFKRETNELNELSECMLLEKVLFFRTTSKKCKTLFYKFLPEALLALKVSKTFLCLLAFILACF